jgi:hypothetical protein
MTAWVVDYANSHPDLDALKAQGCVGIARYVGQAGANQPDATSKNITKPEVEWCRANGFGVALVYEDDGGASGGGPARGYDQGVADAHLGNIQADALGFPSDRPIFYAVDTDGIPQQTVIAYFQGVASVPARPIGGYGQPQLMDTLADLGLIRWLWTTEAWSGGYRSSRSCLFQHAGHPYTAGGDYDENDQLLPDWGQWNPGGTSPTTGDFTVDAEAKARFDAIDKGLGGISDSINRLTVALVPLVAKIDKTTSDDLVTDLTIKHDADVRASGKKP